MSHIRKVCVCVCIPLALEPRSIGVFLTHTTPWSDFATTRARARMRELCLCEVRTRDEEGIVLLGLL